MQYTFIITHYGAGSTVLCRILDQNSKVSALGASGLIYDHPMKLNYLYRHWKKHDNRFIDVAHTVDKLVLNHQLASKSFYDICKFIYMIREPKLALPHIIEHGYSPDMAAEYYAFRLRRMCEMSLKTPNAVILSYDQLLNEKRIEKFKQIDTMLNLRSPLTPYFTPRKSDQKSLLEGKIIQNAEEPNIKISQHLVDYCQLIYEKYFMFLADHLQY